MDILLIPGFWLNASSWSGVEPALTAAGHRVRALTLPGLESVDADRSGIGLRDHVNAVIEVVDSLPGPIVLVGHSGGGAIAHAVVDARPDAITRVVYVDSGPLGNGGVINDDVPEEDGEIPLPEWGFFEDQELVDLDDELRRVIRARAIPEPVRVASDIQVLGDPRRYDVPATVICCTFPAATVRELLAGGHPAFAELGRVRDYEIVDLPTGHWPQFTKPGELAATILSAVQR